MVSSLRSSVDTFLLQQQSNKQARAVYEYNVVHNCCAHTHALPAHAQQANVHCDCKLQGGCRYQSH
jgi:hypothetical protein